MEAFSSQVMMNDKYRRFPEPTDVLALKQAGHLHVKVRRVNRKVGVRG
jgi:hypothetical protein